MQNARKIPANTGSLHSKYDVGTLKLSSDTISLVRSINHPNPLVASVTTASVIRSFILVMGRRTFIYGRMFASNLY